LAVIAVVRGSGPAAAQDSFVPTTQIEVPAEARWSMANAKALLAVIEDSRKEGLNPENYAAADLRAAIDAGQKGAALDALATRSALLVAHDYADGRIDDKASFDWHIPAPMDAAAIDAGLTKALAANDVGPWLRRLLPDNDQYRALRTAYAAADPGDTARLELLRANLERWRWMPRKLGDHYLYVNVPT
jgi:murein L,D-transpeptidase YcbB/YkuD